MLKDLLRTADLSGDDVQSLLKDARELRDYPRRDADLLAGQSVLLYFAKPSTRTRVSFETAVYRLGGLPIVVGPNELQLGRGETIADTARVLSRYNAAIVARTFAHDDVVELACAASVPVINALTDLHHPCQSLADLMTLAQRHARLAGLKVAYLGDGNNVCHSLMEACATVGVNIAVATPGGYEPDDSIVEQAERLARRVGSRVTLTDDPEEAVRRADAVYTDVWVSMGDPEADRSRRERDLGPYRVDDLVMRCARRSAVFMHCLPAHRGSEVSSSVIDGRQSVVFDQAENRLYTEQALLAALVRRSLTGRCQSRLAAAG